MLERREFEGYWWLPATPDRKVPGRLTVSQDDIVLRLLNRLAPITPEGAVEILPPPQRRIVGLSDEDDLVTLECCYGSEGMLANPYSTINACSYRPQYVLVGRCYDEDELIRFDELVIRYQDLDVWASVSGFSTDHQFTHDKQRIAAVNVRYEHPDPIEVRLSPTTTLAVAFASNFGTISAVTTEMQITQRAAFQIRSADPLSLSATRDYVFQLRNFVGLAVGRPVQPEYVAGWLLPSKGAEPDSRTGQPPRKQRVDVIYRLADVVPDEDRKRLYPHDAPFTLRDVNDRLEELFKLWFSKQERLRPVFDLYFGAIYNRKAYLQQTYLTLAQALETYHRRTSDEKKHPPEAYEALVQEVLDVAPEAAYELLEAQLTYANELTLAQRLSRLLKLCPPVAKRVTGKNRKKRDSFVQRVLNARNYLTHYSEESEQLAPNGMDLYPLTVQLRALVEMCLLVELGFDCDEIDAIFERVRRYEEIDVALENGDDPFGNCDDL